MDREFWLERWELGQTAFDQQLPHRWLGDQWPSLGLASDAVVFVPLSGRSVDMVWLAEQGHRVIGVELARAAVEDFFVAVGLEPSIETDGNLDAYRAGPYELWVGDLFEMPVDVLASVQAVYDRASLVALPPDMRGRYVDYLTSVLPARAVWYLVSFSYDQSEMGGPPFSVPIDEIDERFSGAWTIDTVLDVDVTERAAAMRERGLTFMGESLSVLRRR